MWQRGGLYVWDNGGRETGECFDLGWHVWKFAGHFTIYDLRPRESKLLKAILGNSRRSFGISAIGAK